MFKRDGQSQANREKEVEGFYLCGFGRLAIFTSMVFLSLAVIQLASVEANCGGADDNDDYNHTERGEGSQANRNIKSCDNFALGIHPSNILALVDLSSSFASAALMPLLGALIDRTAHRRRVGLGAAYGLIAVNLMQVTIKAGGLEGCVGGLAKGD